MKAKIMIVKEIEFTKLSIKCGVRYWEDSSVDGVEDTDGNLIPLREGKYWTPVVDLNSGIIENWPKGVIANVHYKCCDDGEYSLLSEDGHVLTKEGYVPNILDINGDSYGDYVILDIDANGKIEGWKDHHDISDFPDTF